ncbi:MATE family efflux transporter [Delftia sp. RIT313]|uniref:MATE family efflux transporter n=1 Tax=Delftia sp. RIT313 TaxID=1468410 RepID=UPI0013784EE4|nr:MATE family efflux transporter [Delftia sp. RIT313]
MKIAVNRCATQVASIIIVALLGGASTDLLAAFSLALSAAAIFFVANTAIQYGVQSELGKSFGEGNQRDLFGIFFAGLWLMLLISFFAVGLAYVLPNPFGALGQSMISEEAFLAYRVLVLSLPVVAVSAAIQFLLETYQKITLVFRLRLMTVSLQLIAVLWILHGNPAVRAYEISWAYFATDMIGLIISIIVFAICVDRKALLRATRASCRLMGERRIYFRALKSAVPVSVGAVAQKYLFYYIGIYCASLSTVSASAFAIMNSIIFLLQIPVIGLAHLATIKFSFAYGANDQVMLEYFRKTAEKIFFLMVFPIGLLAWLALPWIVSLFSPDVMVAASIVDLNYLFFLFYFINCCFVILLGMLRGLSDAFYPQLAVNGILFLVIVPLLQLNTALGFSQVVGLFCITGFLAVAGLIARWRRKLGGVLVTLASRARA